MLKKGKVARYMLWTDMVINLNACVNDETEYNKLIYPLKTNEILYIDDFFKTEQGKFPSGADIKRAFEILNYRYNNKLITVISSEKTLTEILDIDQAVGSRIKQMVGSYDLNIAQDKQKNYRLR
jgi:DNA replication protein DnaC